MSKNDSEFQVKVMSRMFREKQIFNYKRIGFHGEDAGEEIKECFIGKRIPETYRKKGKANPCLYSKNTLKDKFKT